MRCVACEFVLYLNPASAAAAVIVDESRRVLLIRRAIAPYQGSWALPAGYQEIDESPRETLRREVREEAGVDVEPTRLLDVVYVGDDPRKPANVIIYLCRLVGGIPQAGSDATEVGWFPLDDLPDDMGFDNRRLLEELSLSPE